MARMTKLESLENQIKNKEEKLFELKEKMDVVSTEIQELIKKRDEARKEEILKELGTSGRSYDEIIEYLRTAPKRNDISQPVPKRKYRARKVKNAD